MALGPNPIVQALQQLNVQKRQRRLDEQNQAGQKRVQSQQGIANLLSLMRAAGGSASPAGRDFGARAGSEMGLGPLSPDYFKADEEAVNKEAQIMAEATKLVAMYNKTIDRDPVTDEVTVIPGMEGINRLVGASLQKLVGGAEDRNVIAEDKRSPLDVSLGATGGMRSLPQTGAAQYGDELMGMYGDILGGPKARPPSTRTISPPAVAGRRPPQAPHPALNKVWPTMSDEEKKQAVQARSLGWTWEQIAEAIGRGK